MAADIDVTPGTGKTVATDEVAAKQHQLVKPGFGDATNFTRASAGAGNVDGGTQRVSLADDDPAVAALATLALESGGNLDAIVTALATKPPANTAPHKFVANGSDYQEVPKGSAGKLWKISAYNFTTSLAYIHLFDVASGPTVASDTCVYSIAVPPASAAGQVGGVIEKFEGMAFSTGIAYSVVSELAKTGTTPIANNGILVNTEYK